MDNDTFAKELVHRLNLLLSDPAVRDDIQHLILKAYVPCSLASMNHPFIRTMPVTVDGQNVDYLGVIGLIGVLNGLLRDDELVLVAAYQRGNDEARTLQLEAFEVDEVGALVPQGAAVEPQD